MRKLPVVLLALIAFHAASAQTTTTTTTSSKKKFTDISRAGDHIMIQLANNSWLGDADSVSKYTKGFNRSANVYLMLNKPFKGDQRFSVGIGVGVGTSNIYFDKMNVNIGSANATLPFVRTDTGNNYKKYKLVTAYLEAPLELRFTANPSNPNKSIKAAVGVKVGTIINAHTKGKGLQTAAGSKLSSSTIKEANKSYFNSTRLAVTGRVGYGIFSLFGSYNITNVFKDGVAADTKLLQVGLTISGL